MYLLMSFAIFICHFSYFYANLTYRTTYHIFLSLPHILLNIHLFLSLTIFFCQLPYFAWQLTFPGTCHSFLPLPIFRWTFISPPVAIFSLVFRSMIIILTWWYQLLDNTWCTFENRMLQSVVGTHITTKFIKGGFSRGVEKIVGYFFRF